jgi:hypothetical protein
MFNCIFGVIVVLLVVPWGYVCTRYLRHSDGGKTTAGPA